MLFKCYFAKLCFIFFIERCPWLTKKIINGAPIINLDRGHQKLYIIAGYIFYK